MNATSSVANWLTQQTKRVKSIALVLSFALVLFVHGFLLRQILVYDIMTTNGFMFLYTEYIFSFFFGGPLCWFTVALLSYLE